MAKRHIIFSDEELEEKSKKQKNKNTQKSEITATNAFQKFLLAAGVDEANIDFWNYSEEDLDKFLAKFWFGGRKIDLTEENSDEEDFENSDKNATHPMYLANTLINFQYGLNRVCKSKGHQHDIHAKDSSGFKKSKEAFTNALKELKKEGKGDIKSHPEIVEEGKCLQSKARLAASRQLFAYF